MYHCTNGLIPQNTVTAMCEGNGRWHPNPASHTCLKSNSNTTLNNDTIGMQTLLTIINF